MSFLRKSVLITGASRGLGLEFVKQMVKLSPGPEIIIACCRNPDTASDLQMIAKENSMLKILKLDVESDEDIDSAVQQTKSLVGDAGLNLLINNAGLNVKSSDDGIYAQTRENLQKHFNINVTSPILLSQKLIPVLEHGSSETPTGFKSAIVNISSIMGSQELTLREGQGQSLHYKCSKSATTMATILMSRQLKESGILVFALHPGWVRTDMGTGAAPLSPEESVAKCLKVVSGADESLTGRLVDYLGNILPY